MNFNFILPPKIIFGEGTLEKIGEEAKRLGSKRVLIVTSRGMLKRESLKRAAESLRAHKLSSEVFARVVPEPPVENVHECAAVARETRSDLLIGLGGGSAMDVAKKTAADLRLPKIMVPTIAGSGSEVTHESVLKVDGEKKAFVEENLVADVAIVDPNLARSLPPRVTASSGMDALAHAIECYQSRRSNLLVKTLAFEAHKLIKDNLSQAVDNVPEARVNLSLGSLMAGMAFGNSGTALCHALSYPLTNAGIPHGEAVATMLPYALEFNGFDVDIIAELKALISALDISVKFSGDINEMARVVMKDTRHLANNPREVSFEDIVDIYHKAQKEQG